MFYMETDLFCPDDIELFSGYYRKEYKVGEQKLPPKPAPPKRRSTKPFIAASRCMP